MIDSAAFVSYLEKRFQFISGVPCTYFKKMLIYLAEHETELQLQHVIATREDEAMGIASGVVFSGKQAVVYMQNSGLGNVGDALTSLAQLYKLPMLLLISYRGLESDRAFPEHDIMGDVNEAVLKAFNIPYWNLSISNWEEEMDIAIEEMKKSSAPVALLVKDGVLSQ